MPDSLFRFHCPHCGRRIKSASDPLGQLVQCPACHKKFTVTQELMLVDDEGASTMPTPAPKKKPTRSTRAVRVAAPAVEEEVVEAQEQFAFEPAPVPAPAVSPGFQINFQAVSTFALLLVVGYLLFSKNSTPTPAPAPAPVPVVPADAGGEKALAALDGDREAAKYFSYVAGDVADLLEFDFANAKKFSKVPQVAENLLDTSGYFGTSGHYKGKFPKLGAFVGSYFLDGPTNVGDLTEADKNFYVAGWRKLAAAFADASR